MNAANLLADSRPLIGDGRPKSTGGGVRPHINPATGKPQADVLVCGAAEIDRAVEAAIVGQRAWMAMGPEKRRDALFRLADLIEAEAEQFKTLAALETGTPVA
ncbi:MAG: aldehyde dehydrogenase family protein, partial [Sphingomonadaceae bacterium]|nr:aldehyde dehydrogenase family protein [Sphingomonadaceae bacterium]